MAHVIGEYQGKPTITLKKNAEGFERYPFSFGLGKAKMILDNIEAIKEFVIVNDKEIEKVTVA